MKTVIIYGSLTGATEGIAQDLAREFGTEAVSATDADATTLAGTDLIILGASTWGMGDLQDDMDDFIGKLSNLETTASFGAVFGLGDQTSYPDSFVDGIADMAAALETKGLKLVGSWPTDGYDYDDSRGIKDGAFQGLVIDEDNQSGDSASRVKDWAAQVKAEAGA